MIISLLIAISIISTVVFIHELGHFITALYFEVPVEEFSIGMGPLLFNLKIKKIKYSLRLIPIGGYVKIKGMDSLETENEFKKSKFYKQFIIIIAGVVMNFVLSFIIFLTLNIFKGYLDKNSNKILKVKGSYFKLNDVLIDVNGYKVENWKQFVDRVHLENQIKNVTIKRQGKKIKLPFTFKNKLDILKSGYPWKRSLLGSFKEATVTLLSGIKNSLNILKGIIIRKNQIGQLSGPIGIIKQINDNSHSITNLMLIIASISISLGVFNLFPFPSLDGGKLFLIIIEKLGFKITDKTENLVNLIGFIILGVLTLVVAKNDILKMMMKK